jgi:carbon storage regulator
MLVLTRRAGESIVIGDDVHVVVLDVRGDTVRLGIDAPRSVQVHRAEVYAEVQAANAAAVSSADDLGAVADRLQRIARPAVGRRAERRPRPTRPPGPGRPGPDRTDAAAPVEAAGPAVAAESSAPAAPVEPAAPVAPAVPPPDQPAPVQPVRPKPGPPPSRPS